ncbi:hypothetical protein [Flavobacterium sp. ACN6]|uniref:hypothetical protein n=1 Tax=Flavobacterium sp. ACN6 TaxID=1920426 RepID=UPI000BB371B9|nr:hypothetical protein [Flavobacterium sp. ACN6]PBJ08089.1 hypothetical protein BSF42_38060 [Flavobacterium sp. ACN6]
MKKKKGLVYDSQKCFSRFLKYEFKEYFEFDVYRNFKNFNDGITDYCIILFVVYSHDELIDLLRIYKRGVPLIVSTFNIDLKAKLEDLEDIIVFDPTKIKSEMRDDLRHFINLVA